MRARQDIHTNIVSLLLIFTLAFPTILQFEHAFEDHHHTICKENTLHFHEKGLDCHINDFHFSSFHFEALSFLPFSPKEAYHQIPLIHEQAVYFTQPYSFTLRGPPTYS